MADGGIRTWRAFLTHMGTVTLGLLIAVGIAQIVESIRHHNQRQSLQRQMRAESEQNLAVVEDDSNGLRTTIQNLEAMRTALDNAKTSGGKLTFAVPAVQSARPGWYFRTPTRATWNVAVSAGRVTLLPAEQAKSYGRLDFNSQYVAESENIFNNSFYDYLTELSVNHLDAATTGSTATLTADSRDRLLRATVQAQEKAIDLLQDLALYKGALESVTADTRSLADMYRNQQKAIDEDQRAVSALLHREIVTR
ncbi:MAG: hypothetical protein PW792_11105 [Acidobacteriaceae bacterium]|nr:hypothetical protein [Acidobacteriaceae bacterium]